MIIIDNIIINIENFNLSDVNSITINTNIDIPISELNAIKKIAFENQYDKSIISAIYSNSSSDTFMTKDKFIKEIMFLLKDRNYFK